MNIIILIGIVAAALELLAMWFTGNKNKLCFPIFGLSGGCWIATALLSEPIIIGLLIIIPILCILHIRNFIKWKRDDKLTTNR